MPNEKAELEAFVVEANEEHPAGIALVLRNFDVSEMDGDLVPSGVMDREQAVRFYEALGELIAKLPV